MLSFVRNEFYLFKFHFFSVSDFSVEINFFFTIEKNFYFALWGRLYLFCFQLIKFCLFFSYSYISFKVVIFLDHNYIVSTTTTKFHSVNRWKSIYNDFFLRSSMFLFKVVLFLLLFFTCSIRWKSNITWRILEVSNDISWEIS